MAKETMSPQTSPFRSEYQSSPVKSEIFDGFRLHEAEKETTGFKKAAALISKGLFVVFTLVMFVVLYI
jgi:hypothetical protein